MQCVYNARTIYNISIKGHNGDGKSSIKWIKFEFNLVISFYLYECTKISELDLRILLDKKDCP